tara:strand:- start:97076 stop:97495 length:420 start_codon:yes stop_codon:yes gene_type:complete
MNNSAKRKLQRMGAGDFQAACKVDASVKVRAAALMVEAEAAANEALRILRNGYADIMVEIDGEIVIDEISRAECLQLASTTKAAATRKKNDALELIAGTKFAGRLAGEQVCVDRCLEGYDAARKALDEFEINGGDNEKA